MPTVEAANRAVGTIGLFLFIGFKKCFLSVEPEELPSDTSNLCQI